MRQTVETASAFRHSDKTARPSGAVFFSTAGPVDRVPSRDTFRRLLKAWHRITRPIGRLQALLILTLIYFVVLAPFALVVRFFLDPLRLRERPTWRPPSAGEESAQRLDWARRLF